MADIKPQQGLMPSILDRLIDPESSGTAWRPGYGQEQVLEVVRRDLEDLLNTRQTATGLTGLARSIFSYGFPELTTFDAVTNEQKRQIGRMLEEIVATFEPRLQDIRATIIEVEQAKDQTIQFRIDARLRVDPMPDVAFQTTLELTSGRYSVEQT